MEGDQINQNSRKGVAVWDRLLFLHEAYSLDSFGKIVEVGYPKPERESIPAARSFLLKTILKTLKKFLLHFLFRVPDDQMTSVIIEGF